MTGHYNPTKFFDIVRRELFPSGMSQSQVEGMNALLAYINQLVWHPVDEETQYFNRWNAYNFATTYHETAYTMQPVTEYGSDAYLRGKSYWPYIGRGFVQLTWKTNYQKSDAEIAAGDLISAATLVTLPGGVVNQTQHVDQALNLEIASCNLMVGCHKGWYTGKKLWDYLRNDRRDYYNARRIVNGLDKASTIKGYAEKFEKAFVGSWEDIPTEIPEPELPPPMPNPEEPIPEPEPEPGIPPEVRELFVTSGADEIRLQQEEEAILIYRRPPES